MNPTFTSPQGDMKMPSVSVSMPQLDINVNPPRQSVATRQFRAGPAGLRKHQEHRTRPSRAELLPDGLRPEIRAMDVLLDRDSQHAPLPPISARRAKCSSSARQGREGFFSERKMGVLAMNLVG